LPRTISNALSHQTEEPEPFHIRDHALEAGQDRESTLRHRGATVNPKATEDTVPQRAWLIGRPIIKSGSSTPVERTGSATPSGSHTHIPLTSLSISQTVSHKASPHQSTTAKSSQDAIEPVSVNPPQQRSIRFPDERPAVIGADTELKVKAP